MVQTQNAHVVDRLDGARLAHHHAALDVVALHTAHQSAQLIAGLCLVENLMEHLHTSHRRLDDLHTHTNLNVNIRKISFKGIHHPPPLHSPC